MTPEGKVKHRIKIVLDHYEVYYHMPVLNGMGKPSLDFICCYAGKFFAIEAKAAGKNLTERQAILKTAMEKAGGMVFKVSNKDEMQVVIGWLDGVKNDNPQAE